MLTVGFVHILGDANKYLRDPCLPESFLSAFPSWADLICCLTIVLLILIDYFMRYVFERKMKTKVKVEECDVFGDPCHGGVTPRVSPTQVLMDVASSSEVGDEDDDRSMRRETRDVEIGGSEEDSSAAASSGMTPPSGESSSHVSIGKGNQQVAKAASNALKKDATSKHNSKHIQGINSAVIPAELRNDVILHRGALLFIEMSVCTHSIPVGLALGLQKGGSFTTLFIAVIFHQILEGFGLGAATLHAKYPLRTELLLSFLFAGTAPIGIVMGIFLQENLNQHSTGYLLTVGFINACAAGMLIYIALEHMNAISSKGKWLRSQPWSYQAYCLGFFAVASAALMVVGKWA